jgi:hypothetical protein
MEGVDVSRGAFRLELECRIDFMGPLAVGTADGRNLRTDSPVLLDDAGRPRLPGSSVRGVLRDWCAREAPVWGIPSSCVVSLFGSDPDLRTSRFARRQEYARAARQGRLTVHDIVIDTEHDTEIRDRVRIDPAYGAADRNGKFSREVAVVPRGVLRLVYQGSAIDDPEVWLLMLGLKALHDGVLAFGSGSGCGLGVVRAEGLSGHAWNRADDLELSAYLLARLGTEQAERASSGVDVTARLKTMLMQTPPLVPPGEEELPGPGAAAWSWLRLTINIQFDGPMLVADFYRGFDLGSNEARADARTSVSSRFEHARRAEQPCLTNRSNAQLQPRGDPTLRSPIWTAPRARASGGRNVAGSTTPHCAESRRHRPHHRVRRRS